MISGNDFIDMLYVSEMDEKILDMVVDYTLNHGFCSLGKAIQFSPKNKKIVVYINRV